MIPAKPSTRGQRPLWGALLIALLAGVGTPHGARAESLTQPNGIQATPPDPAALDPADATPPDPAGAADPNAPEQADKDLLDMDLDQLSQQDVVVPGGDTGLNETVSTVARTETTVGRTPAAVYVVNQEMIRRSGARNLMDVLRTVPGVHVARISASRFAISIRGFNSGFAEKLLVQIDGRAVYTPIFSGTYWDQQLVPLHDIERIEVIRGPGGAVWGANAVNGVINIVTKSSQDTQGVYAEGGAGNEHRSFSHGRVGGALGQNATYRAYGTHTDEDAGGALFGPAQDGRTAGQGGFRTDWAPTKGDTLTLQGDFFGGTSDLASPEEAGISGGNFLGRWARKIDDDRDWQLQVYHDYFKRNRPASLTRTSDGQNVFDVDWQHHVRGDQHEWVWGAGFRSYETYIISPPGSTVLNVPPADAFDTISYFVQDTVTLSEDLLYLTLGSKFEHNDFVGFTYQPTARLACTPDDQTSVWGSVSRAVRTPSIVDRDLAYQEELFPGYTATSLGSRALDAENAMSYEVGLRRAPTERFYWDLACFYTRYEDLIRPTIIDASMSHVTSVAMNIGQADTYGIEWWSTYELAEWLRLRGSYGLYRERFDFNGFGTFDVANVPGSFPKNMAYLGTSVDVAPRLLFDAGVRYVDALTLGVDRVPVASYLELDARLAYALQNGVELALVGQNLLNSQHAEFLEPTPLLPPTQVQRSLFGVVSWGY